MLGVEEAGDLVTAVLLADLPKGRERVVRVPTVAPYDLRHTFCSLLIYEGRSPLMVAAMMGHASGELIWRRYGHVFDEARLASSVGMVDAIQAARKELEGSGTGRKRDAAMVRVLHAPLPTFKKRPLAGGK